MHAAFSRLHFEKVHGGQVEEKGCAAVFNPGGEVGEAGYRVCRSSPGG